MMLKEFTLAFTLLTISQLVSAQNALSLGCFRLPPSGQPAGDDVGGQSGGYGCSEYCRTVGVNLYRYGFYATTEGISTCYCANTAPPNGDYTTCEEDNTYEAYLTQSVFTDQQCYSLVNANGYQEFFVNNMDECIGECFSNNWIITDVVPSTSPNPNPDPEYQLHCRCGGPYYQAPYEDSNRVDCDNQPNNFRVYRYFNLGPSEFARKKKRSDMKLESRGDGTLCPAGLTACKILGKDELSYECIDTDSELESCGGCIHGLPTIGHNELRSISGQDCTSIPGVLPSAVTCSHGRCVIYECDTGYLWRNGNCVLDK